MENASVDFSRHTFSDNLDFRELVFPHKANFNSVKIKNGQRVDFFGATFHSDASFVTVNFPARADFREVEFRGDAIFRDSTFVSIARFNSARFFKTAGFRRVAFSDHAWFIGARFGGAAVFSEATFSKTASFSETVFTGLASFNWAESTGPFSLSEAEFGLVPDFSQMSFRAPVRLDHLRVAQAARFQRIGDKERAASYRALKKIAIESHDHLREQTFFASEARERRGDDDPVGSPNWLFSFVYELLSDFGRSIARPIGWLILSLLGFAAATATYVPADVRDGCKWQSSWLLPEIYVSFLHSLPIVGFGRGEKRDQALICLFGTTGEMGAEKPNVSPAWDMLFIGQNIWSAILIFLFLLAVRNHFRIK